MHDRETLHTFLFADLAGYTALTEAHGDEQAADLASAFCRDVAARIPDGGGELVKTIGDAVMLRIGDAATALRIGLDVSEDAMAQHGSPVVRVGMHRGPAVAREGDWFGTTVNVAARIAGASGGEVLLTDAVREKATGIEGVRFERRGQERLRNLSIPILIFAAQRDGRGVDEARLDPVCRMIVHAGREAGELTHQGRTYVFCSLECAGRFARDPDAYV